jgi:hypothetical protein
MGTDAARALVMLDGPYPGRSSGHTSTGAEYPTDRKAAAIVGNVGDRVVRLGKLVGPDRQFAHGLDRQSVELRMFQIAIDQAVAVDLLRGCCMEKIVKQRTCELCGDEMILVRTTPRFGALPELESFRCVGCGDVQTFEAGLEPPQSCGTSVAGVTENAQQRETSRL